jgi:hypothetical protein
VVRQNIALSFGTGDRTDNFRFYGDQLNSGGPQMKSFLNDPKHWRDRAEQTRTKADRFWQASEKLRMMRIADEYDRLADRAQRSVELLAKK